jgi:hypothetical protein
MTEFNKSTEDYFYRANLGLKRFMIESTGWVGTHMYEVIRQSLVNCSTSPCALEHTQRAILSPETTNPYIYSFLQNTGDYVDGYYIPFYFYNALAIIDSMQSLITRKNIPESIKLGSAIMAGSISVFALESGLLNFQKSTPDWADVPAGLAGVATYVGVHILARKFAPKLASISS